MRRLFADSFSKELRTIYAVAVACMVVGASMTAFSAWLMRDVVNDIFVGQDASKILILGGTVMAVFFVKGFAAYGETIALERIGNAITRYFQIRMIEKITALSAEFFESKHSSNLITRISKNGRSMADAVMLVSTALGRNLLTLIALGAVMVAQDVIMSAIVLVIVPIVVWGLRRLVQKIRELDSDEFANLAAVIAATQETLRGIHIVKAFSLERQMQEQVGDAARGAETRRNAIAQIKASISPFMESLGGLAIGLVIFYAGWQTVTMGKTPGEFMAFLTAFLMSYEPAKRLAGFNVTLQRSTNRARMVYRLLDDPNIEIDRPSAKPLVHPKGHIVFVNVDFSYSEDVAALEDFSIEIEPGAVTALVGPSGAGKSTVFKLIQRLYHPTRGRILIDGTDISDITIKSLRANMALVTQDTFLFSGTIYENIAYGKPDAGEEAVRAAAETALVHEFAGDLKKGLETHVGENGKRLSGGQRQRIAIARALLRDAPILLLDEATSSLDNESDRAVRNAISELTRDRTTVVIAHRLSTVMNADKICFLEKGRVVETGTHDELMAARGPYARLFKSGEIAFEDAT